MADLDTTHYITVAYQSDLYVTDSTLNYGFLVRIQSKVLTLEVNSIINAAPDAELVEQLPIYLRTSGGKNRFGGIARRLVISRLQGTSPTQFRIYRTIPILTSAIITAINENPLSVVISYEGETDWDYVSVRKEVFAS